VQRRRVHEIEIRRLVVVDGLDLVFVFTSAFDLQDGAVRDGLAEARLLA